MSSEPQKHNRPIHEIRIGSVVAAIWANAADGGRTYHTVTPYRVYKDGQGQWHRSTSFDRDDLPLLVKVADRAHDYIFNLAASPAAPVPAPQPTMSRLAEPPPAEEPPSARNARRTIRAPG